MPKIISWNLLHLAGASVAEIVNLIEWERPDLLLMQEATPVIDHLPASVGGFYTRCPLPGRRHGLATWAPKPPSQPPVIVPIPSGALFDWVGQIIGLGDCAVANVHLSHGQALNRRQLRRIARLLPYRAIVMGDFNLLGPCLLPGFRDVGPRHSTHVAGDIVPLRIDRCLVRGLHCTQAAVLSRASSDHRPIAVELESATDTARAAA
jgi:endonuclease/exonuclease/phosphatase (EEP) superfamily protein YafD